MMKRIAFILTVYLLLCVALCGCTEGPETPFHIFPLNYVWEFEGNRISFTEATIADTYLAPDGTEYSKDEDDVLVIARCRAIMAPGWNIAHVAMSPPPSSPRVRHLCDPITEVSDSGEETLIYLFSIPKEGYAGNLLGYHVSVNIVSSEGDHGSENFVLIEKLPE